MIAIVLGILLTLLGMGDNKVSSDVVIVAPSREVIEAQEWDEFHSLAVAEYEDMFTDMFNSYETKWSKNNRLMIRSGSSGSYKFVKKG